MRVNTAERTIAGMAKDSSTAFKDDFTRRVLVMRRAAGLTQEQVAQALGITLSGYQHYESSERSGRPGRSFMPHHLIPKFCQLTQFPVDYLYGMQKTRAHPGATEVAQ